ncbi:hypothetical protein [Halorientalis halophila]|uniref:hypothetical protein n=1 Tax=Halorientalis halophila TaxID=3108499 RepID=UPI00300BD876
MGRTSHPLTSVVFGLGTVLIVISVAFPEAVGWETIWMGIGGVYATTAVLFKLYERYGEAASIPFTYSLFVAIASILVAYGLQATGWIARGHAKMSLESFLWPPHLMIPFGIAFLAPYAISEREKERKMTEVLVGIFLVIAINVQLYRAIDDWIAPWLAIIYIPILFLVGLVAGIPMYWYCWVLDAE